MQKFNLKWGEETFGVHETDRHKAIDQCIFILKMKGYRNICPIDFEDIV
jgi:hypothetical protein